MLRFGKILNSHLFWLNSHPGRACLVLRACRSAAFLDHDVKKGCEFNQKRCELKNFQDLINCLNFVDITSAFVSTNFRHLATKRKGLTNLTKGILDFF